MKSKGKRLKIYEKKQNECLNFVKGIACFGIVYMHTSYDCMLSSMIVNLFRFALLYCYIALYLINKFNKYNLAYILAAVLLVAHIVARGLIQYNQLVPEEINIIWFRNFIFMGFPFFMIGNYMHKKEDKIVNRLSNKTLVIGILFGLALSCVERYIVVLEVFGGTILASLLIFCFALQNPDKKVIPVIAKIGQKYSMQIYIFQLIANEILICLGNNLHLGIQLEKVFAIVKPLLIYISITLVCMLVKEVKTECRKLLKP